jgi:acyl carrier protein
MALTDAARPHTHAGVHQDAPRAMTDPRIEQILDIVAKETAIDRSALRLDATIEALGISSLDMTQAVFEIETVFDIEIPVLAAGPGAEFNTVGDLVRHVLTVLDKPRDGNAETPGRVPPAVPGQAG